MKQKIVIKEKRLEPIKFKVVPRLLDHIGVAMYSKFNKAIGELVVNGYDADALRVEVNINANKISIKDNGYGMNEQEIRNEYMILGSDHKRKIKRTLKYNRLPIGNKGIGKLAGLGIAKKMTVITTKDHNKYKYEIDRDELEKAKSLEEAYQDLIVEFCKEGDSGTVIELTKLLQHVKINIRELRGYLAREIPQDNNFQIYVNGEKCLRKDIPAKKKIPVYICDELCGEIKGEISVAKKVLTSIKPGIFTTVRGRVVGPPCLFDVTKNAPRYRQVFVQFITGAVEVQIFDPEEITDEIPVIKTDRDGFNEDHPKYKRYFKIMKGILNKICREEETEFERKKEAEKEAKVKKALKNIISDFNAYNKLMNQQIKGEKGNKVQIVNGGDKVHVETDEILEHTKGSSEGEKINPVGITDKHLREELKGIAGHGNIYIGNKRYKITTKPMGIDDYECRIDDNALIININIDHPSYEQAVAEKSVEIPVFRAIAVAFALKESNTPIELYERLDEMIRFQAERMEIRRTKSKIKVSEVLTL